MKNKTLSKFIEKLSNNKNFLDLQAISINNIKEIKISEIFKTLKSLRHSRFVKSSINVPDVFTSIHYCPFLESLTIEEGILKTPLSRDLHLPKSLKKIKISSLIADSKSFESLFKTLFQFTHETNEYLLNEPLFIQ